MISLLSQHARSEEALDLFFSMLDDGVHPNIVSYLCAIDASSKIENDHVMQEVYDAVVSGGFAKNLVVGSALINMYGKWGHVHKARNVFNNLPVLDTVPWTAMITAYAGVGDVKEALCLFYQMESEDIKPDSITYVSILDMCGRLSALEGGLLIHCAVEEHNRGQDVMVATALINMYGKCACVHEAQNVFDGLLHRDTICFNAMITAYHQNDFGEEALNVFYCLYFERIQANNVSFICTADACSSLAALELGREVHASAIYEGFNNDTLFVFALIQMYGKCGSIVDAKCLFGHLSRPNLVTWNAMISLLSQNGESKEALALFHQMQAEGIWPDDSTFVSVLTACGQSGLVDYGKYVVYSLRQVHYIPLSLGHFVALLNLLSRAGMLDEAEVVIYNMPLEFVGVAWRYFLSACIIHGDKERGTWAALNCYEIEPMNVVPYIMMSNLSVIPGTLDNL